MRNLNLSENDDDYSVDYGPNRLAELSQENPRLYREIVNSNLEEGDTIERWENRNLERAKDDLAWQRRNRS